MTMKGFEYIFTYIGIMTCAFIGYSLVSFVFDGLFTGYVRKNPRTWCLSWIFGGVVYSITVLTMWRWS